MARKNSLLSDNELKMVSGGLGTPMPEDYMSRFSCPECGSRDYIVVKFPRMHFFCRDCETVFSPA